MTSRCSRRCVASCDALEGTHEDLQQMPPEQMIALVIQLRGIVRAHEQELMQTRDEREAALLLNELCHY